jgi:MYXO-CTERM domain-containing protein
VAALGLGFLGCASGQGSDEPVVEEPAAAVVTCTTATIGSACVNRYGSQSLCGLDMQIFPEAYCCDGCLKGRDCQFGDVPSACGYGGLCATCGPCEECDDHGDCVPSAPGTACGACGVCNDSNECVPGPPGKACGACHRCDAEGECAKEPVGTACPDGVCRPDGNCCTGCVDFTGLCRYSSSEQYCGSGGGACQACDECSSCQGDTCVPVLADGAACNDASACTEGDACLAGHCVGSPVSCPDAPCGTGSCDPAQGCVLEPAADPGATACDDGNDCTPLDVCFDHDDDPATLPECRGTSGVACNDDNPCTSDQCDGSECPFTPLPDGTSCTTGNRCIAGETCTGGECSGSPRDCDDDDPCTIDSCQPGGTGMYVNPLTGCKNVPQTCASGEGGASTNDPPSSAGQGGRGGSAGRGGSSSRGGKGNAPDVPDPQAGEAGSGAAPSESLLATDSEGWCSVARPSSRGTSPGWLALLALAGAAFRRHTRRVARRRD